MSLRDVARINELEQRYVSLGNMLLEVKSALVEAQDKLTDAHNRIAALEAKGKKG